MDKLYKFKVMEHGKREFDKNYFGIFFKKYDKSELAFYYRWFKGWINLLDQYVPLKNGRGKKALEVGCAIGAFAKLLKERDFEVTAMDISEYIIERAKKLQKDINFKVSDIEKDSIKEKFDYIFAFEVVEHLKYPKKALFNMKRMLKSEGTIVFSTPLPTKQTLADPMHINVHPPQFWISLGKTLGFNITTYKKVAFLPLFYRFHPSLSIGFPTKFNLPFVNNTVFYFFKINNSSSRAKWQD